LNQLGHAGSNPVHACQRNASSVRCSADKALGALARGLLKACEESRNWRVLRTLFRSMTRGKRTKLEASDSLDVVEMTGKF
jgi:hypothetical protein